jgi:nucleoside-diphosphate-sugar epimerase
MVVGHGENVWSFVHVDDVAEAYRLVAKKRPIGKTFTLADDEPCTYAEFANFVADQMGKPHVRHMPKWLASVLLGRVLCKAMTMNQRVKNIKTKTELSWNRNIQHIENAFPLQLQKLKRRHYESVQATSHNSRRNGE